jgi:5-hydroxyisourate hydrolase
LTTISSHILDSTNGRNASGIRVTCHRLQGNNNSLTIFDAHASDEGRISFDIDTSADISDTQYEVVFMSGEYFANRQSCDDDPSIVSEVVVRLDLSGEFQRCHVPIMIAPHNYALWWSR